MKLLIINPGSTSTKISLYEDETCLLEDSIFHDAPVLLQFPHVNGQVGFRLEVTEEILKRHGYSVEDVDVFVGRGGSAHSCRSGVMEITDQLYEDTRDTVGGSEHPAKLGVMMAYELSKRTGKKCYTLNPTNVDELCDEARITGIKGLYRNAQSHVLNQKAVARYHCESHGMKYEESDLIVCHIDGGITVNAHQNGKMIDGNVGSGGDGSYTPTRIGSVPVLKLLDYLEDHSLDEVRRMCSRSGGFVSFFGTSDADKIHKLVEENDPKATLLWNAMIYNISKQIGAMAAVLKGKVDAILLTGGLMRFDDVSSKIRESCGWIADIYVYPGEMEQKSLALETLKALKGESEMIKYEGRDVFEGFDFID
ncbi:MAG: butyrate kinase [Erysipelotrichaceae bacterium]|nr:butyrate kinase [Erysipelotrichaceae bacterium]